ncbi:N-acetylmuramoyl-L-alanine amidase, partial [Mycobacterium tuberculosis]
MTRYRLSLSALLALSLAACSTIPLEQRSPLATWVPS